MSVWCKTTYIHGTKLSFDTIPAEVCSVLTEVDLTLTAASTEYLESIKDEDRHTRHAPVMLFSGTQL
jgi:hypothetical protein